MKKKLLLVLILSMVVVLALPNMVLAQAQAQITITGLIFNVARVIWIIATVIVVIFWVLTGVLFLASAGDPHRLTHSKNALLAAIAGTILVVPAWSL